MSDYTHVAEQMKEMIIEDFLKKNPGITRDQVITKTINGRLVISTVNETFKKLESQKKGKRLSEKEREVLNKLWQGGDERYAASIESVQSSLKYVDWLHKAKFSKFDDEERKSTLEFISKRQEEAGQRALELLSVRKKLTNAMNSEVKPSRSLIKTLVMEYTHATLNQCKAQGAIFGKEIELTERFSNIIRKFLQRYFDKFSRLDQSVLLAIGKACQIMNQQDLSKVTVTGQENPKQVKEALDACDDRLKNLRHEYDMIQKIVAFLENMLDELSELDEEPVDATPKEEANPPRQRMAYTSKKGRR